MCARKSQELFWHLKSKGCCVCWACLLIRVWSFSLLLSDLTAPSTAYWEKDKLRERNIVAFIDPAIKQLLYLHFFLIISFSFPCKCLFLLQLHLSTSDYLLSLFLWPSLSLSQREASTERRKSDIDGGKRWSEGGKQTDRQRSMSVISVWSLSLLGPIRYLPLSLHLSIPFTIFSSVIHRAIGWLIFELPNCNFSTISFVLEF